MVADGVNWRHRTKPLLQFQRGRFGFLPLARKRVLQLALLNNTSSSINVHDGASRKAALNQIRDSLSDIFRLTYSFRR